MIKLHVLHRQTESGNISDNNQANDDIILRAQTQKPTHRQRDNSIDISICMMQTHNWKWVNLVNKRMFAPFSRVEVIYIL